jgi:hypothetical protein
MAPLCSMIINHAGQMVVPVAATKGLCGAYFRLVIIDA